MESVIVGNDNNNNSNNNNSNNVINDNYKYNDDNGEDTTSIGDGVVTIEGIILANASFDDVAMLNNRKEQYVQDDYDAVIVADDKSKIFEQLYEADDDDDASKWSFSTERGNNDDRNEFIGVRVEI